MNVERLIEEVRKYPTLYDLRDKTYKNTDLRERIWRKIADDLEIEGKE